MRLGVAGSGFIVTILARTLKDLDNVCPVAMWTMPNDTEAAGKLAQNMGIGRIYADYDEFLSDPEIDVVYVGIINSKHHEFAKRALLAGKPVILEKPFTCSYAEAKELAALARERNLMLIEAVSFLYSPNYRLFKQAVDSLKGIKMVDCRYIQYSSRYDSYLDGKVLPAFNPQLAGGALYDINIYNLNLVVGLFGRPQSCHYHANIGFNGIDTSGVAILDYGDFKAVCIGGKDAQNTAETVITARNGSVTLDGAANVFVSFSQNIDGVKQDFCDRKYATHMVYEFREFERIFRENDLEAVNRALDYSLEVMRIADQLRKEAGICFPCDITEEL